MEDSTGPGGAPGEGRPGSPVRPAIGLAVAAAGALALVALASYEPRDYAERAFPVGPEVRNLCGPAGAAAAALLLDWIGVLASYALAGAAVVAGLRQRRAAGGPEAEEASLAGLAFVRPLGATAAVLALATVEHLLHRGGLLPGDLAPAVNPGGAWGVFLATALLRSFDGPAAYAVAAAAGAVGLLLALDVSLGRSLPERKPVPAPAPVPLLVRAAPVPSPAPLSAVTVPLPVPESAAVIDLHDSDNDADDGHDNDNDHAREHEHEEEEDFVPAEVELEGTYSLPPVTMLSPAEAGPVGEHESVMREKAAVLERTLQNFKVEARVVAVDRGPNITQYELELAAGVKVGRIMGLSDDLALAMKAPSIRIIAPIPGKSTVGVEVPNQDQDTVRLRELIETEEYGKRDYAIPLFLGKDSTGNPLIADLARMPHLLIAGATGSGKSVCMNTIIASVLMTRKPAQVKMILIDPKMVELSLYESIPHLLAPVVTDMRKAPSVLEWAVNKMEERYALLSRLAVRHIKNYNALGRAEIAARLEMTPEQMVEEKIPHHLPYIVVVIDEFADLMCVARKEVEGSVIRLAQKSRAVGIHLLLATQRPTADVITGLIKSNMPCRIAFQVASKVDSRTIIDKNGAEMLVGQGDLLYLPPGTANVIRAQGTYISEEEVKAVVKFTKAAAAPEFQPELLRAEAGEAGAGDGEGGGADDDLYDPAVRIILETGRGSASLLQRRLEIGYSRASRLIDIMTERGVLGPFKGSKAREILLTLEDWEAMKAREGGEAEAA